VGKIVNRTDAAKFFGVALTTIDGWLASGMPYVEKPGENNARGWKLDVAQILEWHRDRERQEALRVASPAFRDQLAAVQLRKESAITAKHELELAKLQGHLVTLDDVEAVWSRQIATCRTRLLGVPSHVAPLAFSAETVHEVRQLIEAAIHEALDELSATARAHQSPSNGTEASCNELDAGDVHGAGKNKNLTTRLKTAENKKSKKRFEKRREKKS
jgi:phage terminase Nu1 subunit (DNA packaging protein)